MKSAQTVALEEASKRQFQGLAENYLWILVAVGVAVLVFIAWLYYYDWRKSRGFRRYWEGKRRKQQ